MRSGRADWRSRRPHRPLFPHGIVQRLSLQGLFSFTRAPRNGGQAAERNAGFPHPPAIHVESDRGGSQGECEALAIANLDIGRSACPRARVEQYGANELARLKGCLDLRRRARLL